MRRLSFLFAALLFSYAAFADEASFKFRTPADVQSFAQAYYLKPRPELVAPMIEAMSMTGYFQRATSSPPFIGFFSEVFLDNRDRLPDWQALIDKQDTETKAALLQAVALSKAGGATTVDGNSGSALDTYWGAFFASGNPAYINKLVDQLRFWDERDSFVLFMAGYAAKWSLASNAQSHALVRSILIWPQSSRDTRTQELISELLAQGPPRVKQDAFAIMRKQQETGKW